MTTARLFARILPFFLTIGLALGCDDVAAMSDAGGADDAGGGESDAGGTDAGPGAMNPDAGMHSDAGVDAGGLDGGSASIEPQVVRDTRCGLEFSWLPPGDVGHLVSFDTPHSTLTTTEATVVQLRLLREGVRLSRSIRHDTRAHRMVYTTQDRGVMREASALVVFPQLPSTETLPVLLWHHGTTGLADMCAPSFDIEDSSSSQYAVAALLSVFASYGYIIVAPDYLGQNSIGAPSPALHPYLVGEPTAIASLDAIDAARELAGRVTAPSFGRIAVWGASQGGHAALFSALYAPHYAPDLDIGAGVYVVPPTDVTTHMARGVSSLSPPSGNAALWLAGAQAWYEPPTGLTDVVVSPYDAQLPGVAATDCSPDIFDAVTNTNQVFTPALLAGATSGSLTGPAPWHCYADESSITRTALAPPTFPGLVIYGEDDTLVDTAIERAAFPTLCARGHNLAYLECRDADHGEGFFFSVDDALDFIDEQLASPTAQSCRVRSARRCSSEL